MPRHLHIAQILIGTIGKKNYAAEHIGGDKMAVNRPNGDAVPLFKVEKRMTGVDVRKKADDAAQLHHKSQMEELQPSLHLLKNLHRRVDELKLRIVFGFKEKELVIV